MADKEPKSESNPRAPSGNAPTSFEARSAGLCDLCRWVRVQGTKRGARFYRCGLADEDDRFRRYPPLPVMRCNGFDSTND